MALPELREELDLLPGPVLADGQPSWTLHDPVRNLFFSLDWTTFEILTRWSYDDPESIVASISASTTLHLEPEEVLAVIEFLQRNQLVKPAGADSSRKLAEMRQRQQGSRLSWLLHHYLFFRVPLWKPDAWLQRWLPVAELFFSRSFFVLTLVALLLGLSQVIRQWDSFVGSLVDTFSLRGLLNYGIALVLVKVLHELGHAFTARRMGCRVPTMGAAFLVMWPMAYTDTNETWRLTSRWQRLQVAAAGIITELAIASWCTLGWALLPDGGLREACFVLATTSWIATLAINASPLMRFDGYFILSDWLDLPNLHQRSFALARWHLRELLFDLREPIPEHFARTRERGLILFAWLTWIYRLVVFFGIAILVYHFFIKLVGILLFIVEIAWFIAMPILNELKAWRERWAVIRSRRRSRITLLVVLTLLSLLILPWPGRLSASAQLRPAEVWPLFAPGASRIASLQLSEGAQVSKDQLLIELHAPELEQKRTALIARIASLRSLADTAGFDAETRAYLQSRREELATATAELSQVEKELELYRPKAPFAGQLRDLDPDLQVGQWLSDVEPIGLLVGEGSLVETWLDEEQVKRIQLGDSATFISDGIEGPMLQLRVIHIDADATRSLDSSLLTVQAGGSILARPRKDALVPEHAVYRVVLLVQSPLEELSNQSWRGEVVIHAGWESPASRYLRNLLAILVREASF